MMASSSPTHTGLLSVWARCDVCGWSSDARNALGNAAQHARRSGHEVYVEQTTFVFFNRKSP